jgi:hypothetical protein
MRKKKIKVPLYFVTLVLVQAKDISCLNKKLDIEVSNKTTDAYMYQRDTKNGDIEYYMVFKKKTTAQIIAHESVHTVNAIFNRVHIEPNLHNDESQAYLMGWIVKQCHKFLKVK